MDWSTLGDLGLVALGIAILGLPIQIALGFAVGMGRRVPVAIAVFMPVTVLILGLVGVERGYAALARQLADLSDPAWAPWFTLYDRANAVSPAPMCGMLALVLTVPAMVGAAAAALREDRRGTIGPAVAAGGGLFAGLGLCVVAQLVGRPSLALPGLLLALLALLCGGSLAAVRPRYLSVPGIGIAGLITGALGLAIMALAGAELVLTDVLDDLNTAWMHVSDIAAHEHMVRTIALSLFGFPLLAVATTLPALGLVRSRDAGARQGLDIALSGAMLGGALLAVGWVLIRRSMLGRLAGAHAAWVLAAAPPYDVPRRDTLPPRVLIPSDPISTWVELREGGGVSRHNAPGAWNEVGKDLQRGDGVIAPADWHAEDLYLLVADAPAGAIALVGCSRVSPEVGRQILDEPVLAIGRCGSFPLELRVMGPMPDPRELILVPGKLVQDGLDVIDLADLKDVSGRDVILRMQADCTMADIVAGLDAVRTAATVYLGWGVTIEGDDLAIGVEPGLRVVEKVPVPPVPGAAEALPTDAAPPAGTPPATPLPAPSPAPTPPAPAAPSAAAVMAGPN